MFSKDNRILHKGTLEALESLEKIEKGTEVVVPGVVKGYEVKLIATEIKEEKVVWKID